MPTVSIIRDMSIKRVSYALSALVIACLSTLEARWVQSSGFDFGNVTCLPVSPASGGFGTNLFAGTDGGRLSFHQQRHNLDCRENRLDEHTRLGSCCLQDESLCRD